MRPWNHGQISPYRASCADAGSCDDAGSRFTCGNASDLRHRFVAGEGSAGCLGFLGGMLFAKHDGAGETDLRFWRHRFVNVLWMSFVNRLISSHSHCFLASGDDTASRPNWGFGSTRSLGSSKSHIPFTSVAPSILKTLTLTTNCNLVERLHCLPNTIATMNTSSADFRKRFLGSCMVKDLLTNVDWVIACTR